MKMLMCIASNSVMNDLVHLFESQKLNNFHVFADVTGRMLNCDLRMNTAVFPDIMQRYSA
jgi:hypothetical protein